MLTYPASSWHIIAASSWLWVSCALENNGGWLRCKMEAEELLSVRHWESSCGVRRIAASDINNVSQLFSSDQPILVYGKGAVDPDVTLAGENLFGRLALLERLGDRRLAFAEAVNHGSGCPEEGTTLRAYVESHMGHCRPHVQPYIFYRFSEEADACRNASQTFRLKDVENYPESPLFLDSMTKGLYGESPLACTRYFGLGGLGTGLGFHQHGDAWSQVVFGQRLWLLLSPMSETGDMQRFGGILEDMLHALRAYNDSSSLQVCLQRPGEVMFIPQYWYHRVVNVGETVSISSACAIRGLSGVKGSPHGLGSDELPHRREL